MNDKTEYLIEQEGVSDDEYEIVNILFENGQKVSTGDVILEYETSKTIVEVGAEKEGYFYTTFRVGDVIKVGELAAVILDNLKKIEEIEQFKSSVSATTPATSNVSQKDVNTDKEVIYTESATDLISELAEIEDYFPDDTFITKSMLISKISSQLFHLPIDGINSQNKLVLIGAGGMVETAIQAAREQGRYQIVGILDSKLEAGYEILGVPVLGSEDQATKLLESGVSKAIITFASVGKRSHRQEAFNRIKLLGFTMVNIIHPLAIVDSTSTIGEGNLILEGSKIGTECVIGDNNYINVGSVICHHSKLLGNTHLAPNCTVAGDVVIEQDCLIGMGSTVVSGCTIGKNTVINNGVSVITDTKENSVIKGFVGKNDS